MLFLQPEPSLKTEKAAARRWARQTRAAFTPEQWDAFGAAMAQRLCLLPQWQAAQTVFCFASHGPEPDTLPLLQAALAEGKQLCVPRCTGPGQMEAIPLGDLALLAPGSYGIPEPPAQLPPCPPAGIQLAVLPCLAAGLERYIDGYSLHYTWQMKEQDFVKFFRELSPGTISNKLVNSEESAFSHPSDVIKLMARDLYLHGFESVYCYLARDRMEGASLNRSGFFDIDWRPKLRLLSSAAAADAMKTRDFVRMAEPAEDVEAYLLQNNPAAPAGTPKYAVVLWKNGAAEAMNPDFTPGPTLEPATVHFRDGKVVKAVDWLLDEVPFTTASPQFEITERPLVVYCDELPSWPEVTRGEWLKKHRAYTVAASEAVVPAN